MLTIYERETILKLLFQLEPPSKYNPESKLIIDFNSWEWATLSILIKKLQSESVFIDHDRLREYAMTLEMARRDLWGANEELREKISALENGQLDLQEQYENLSAEHSRMLSNPKIG